MAVPWEGRLRVIQSLICFSRACLTQSNESIRSSGGRSVPTDQDALATGRAETRQQSSAAVPTDPTALADPAFILLTWAAGLAWASGLVATARIVGPGFTWLTASVAALISLGGVFVDDAWWARLGLLALGSAILVARNRGLAGLIQLAAGGLLLAEAALIGGPVPAATATFALGGVTGEMMLGHWYLIDPRLPRWALRGLALAGIIGLLADAFVLAVFGLPEGGATITFWILLVTSVVLMIGVIGALRYPAYSGVMAATGLSYLAVLTSLGAIFLGRALVAGISFIGA